MDGIDEKSISNRWSWICWYKSDEELLKQGYKVSSVDNYDTGKKEELEDVNIII